MLQSEDIDLRSAKQTVFGVSWGLMLLVIVCSDFYVDLLNPVPVIYTCITVYSIDPLYFQIEVQLNFDISNTDISNTLDMWK